MRISDWSSDVCSSDLKTRPGAALLPCPLCHGNLRVFLHALPSGIGWRYTFGGSGRNGRTAFQSVRSILRGPADLRVSGAVAPSVVGSPPRSPARPGADRTRGRGGKRWPVRVYPG